MDLNEIDHDFLVGMALMGTLHVRGYVTSPINFDVLTVYRLCGPIGIEKDEAVNCAERFMAAASKHYEINMPVDEDLQRIRLLLADQYDELVEVLGRRREPWTK